MKIIPISKDFYDKKWNLESDGREEGAILVEKAEEPEWYFVSGPGLYAVSGYKGMGSALNLSHWLSGSSYFHRIKVFDEEIAFFR